MIPSTSPGRPGSYGLSNPYESIRIPSINDAQNPGDLAAVEPNGAYATVVGPPVPNRPQGEPLGPDLVVSENTTYQNTAS